jgi:glutathione peroxidase-family protein
VETIALKYKTTTQKIIDFPYNQFADDKYSLTVGQTIIVPDGIKN